MTRLGRWAILLAVPVFVVAGAVVFASAREGVLGRLDKAYAEWSLRSRIGKLWEARIAGDLDSVSRFIIKSCEPRALLGTAVRYYGFEIREIEMGEDDVAEVKLDVAYKVVLPGLFSESSPPQHTEMTQRWVRAGWTWFWDPGPAGLPGRIGLPAPSPVPAAGTGAQAEGR